MIGTGQRRITQRFTDCRRRAVCQQLCAGGRPVLVVNDGERLFLTRQAEHGFGKVGAAGGIHPAGTENQVTRVALLQRQFTGAFGFTVDVQRAGCLIFPAIMAAGAVEHIVRGIVHHQGTQLRRLRRQHRHPFVVQQVGELPLAFGLVHCRVCGGIHHHVRADSTHGLRDTVQISQITAQLFIKVVHRDHITERGQ